MPEANPSGKTKQNQKRKKWFLPVNKPSPKKPKETTPQTGSCNESTERASPLLLMMMMMVALALAHKFSNSKRRHPRFVSSCYHISFHIFMFSKQNKTIIPISPENFCLFFKYLKFPNFPIAFFFFCANKFII